MAEFLTATGINLELEKLIKNAKQTLLLVSPYIKLHDRLRDQLKQKKDLHNLEITLVFGKNEEDVSKSMNASDLDFFLTFPNLEIHYEKNLHAKYYANEYKGLISSMNLHQFSQNSNIEIGVLYEHSDVIDKLANKLIGNQDIGDRVWNYFHGVIENSELIYQKIPEYESKLLGLTKRYKSSKEEVNRISEFFKSKRIPYQYESSFSEKQSSNWMSVQKTSIPTSDKQGFCIRCKSSIPFNIYAPYCNKCYSIWEQFENPFYEETICHLCCNPEKTTMDKPLCYSCYKKLS